MKKLLTLLAACCLMLFVFGCSDSPNVAGPQSDSPSVTLVERPQFTDTRPAEQIQHATLTGADVDLTDIISQASKKPPKPEDPPDTGTTGDDPNPNPAHKYAYIVGISDYEGTVNDLQYCDDDALAMRSMLQGEGFTIRMDNDRAATAATITEGLEWLVASAQPGDEIAFVYSGHGAKAPGAGSSLISTDLYYLTHSYVMDIFNAANCTKKLVTLDACVIGDFHADCATGTMMATASNRTNSYDAPDLRQGAWTYYYLEAAEDLNMIYAEDCAT
ncbi:MAG: caspase family protein, partial [candidate division Zixibacteria bacterium]|nr:caspase family protein [candidate division Zixibacteria bacterium]